ncbi:MAG TPA: AAA family ATPase [Streptosporangiaceae bacterium]
MTEVSMYPSYVERGEEDQISQAAAQVRQDGQSRAILLYGTGGVGKTWLVRHLVEANSANAETVWVRPIDMDDSEYWLLSNLERLIAENLDPGNEGRHFSQYLDYLSRLPQYLRPRVGHETVISHLGRIKDVFLQCYRDYIDSTGKSVVITFDTVEAIRGMDLLVTLTQLMKQLPATLFILSGRPQPPTETRPDPIKSALEDPYLPVPLVDMQLEDFTEDVAREYLDNSGIGAGLTGEEKRALVRLTRGHPLWLAFTVSYLGEKGLPEEAGNSLQYIEERIPYQGDVGKAGQDLQEAFNRRLVSSYREADFWHEAIKRLAVARKSVSQSIWRELMADSQLPEGVSSLDEAWPILLDTPWIRPRANAQYVTLHDVVAEELARRIFPIHDQGKEWRHTLWTRAARVYGERIDIREAELVAELATLDTSLEDRSVPAPKNGGNGPAEDWESAYIDEAAKLDVQRRELSQFKTVGLYYQLLCDFPKGCQLFHKRLDEARRDHDVPYQELLVFEMERFLPGGAPYIFGDVIGEVIEDFRAWLTSAAGVPIYLQMALDMADCLIRSEQPQAAVDLLERLPADIGSPRDRFRLSNLLGNAYMRNPGHVREGLRHFQNSLDAAIDTDAADQLKLVAKAHKELGFFYRHRGLWADADESYQQAFNAISQTLSTKSDPNDREEMASIQTNWAYVKGLVGDHREGTNLVETAISVRRRLKRRHEEGISWSTCGEIYRYERRFQMAWKAYAAAERIFEDPRNWAWLGLIYQEQAICLFQAVQDGIEILPGQDALAEAKRLIALALNLCRDLAIRGYPSALNRAGRIFGQEDIEAGLKYLAEGIDSARQLSDGWFWFANLIEHVELSYRAWEETGQQAYLDLIVNRGPQIAQAGEQFEFPDLRGRWKILQGYLRIGEWRTAGDASSLDSALEFFKVGFAEIAQQHVGSSGAAAIPGVFRKFATMMWGLPDPIQAQWQGEFRRAWSGDSQGATLLLARLEELY